MMSTVSRSSSGNVGGGQGRKRSLCAIFDCRLSMCVFCGGMRSLDNALTDEVLINEVLMDGKPMNVIQKDGILLNGF